MSRLQSYNRRRREKQSKASSVDRYIKEGGSNTLLQMSSNSKKKYMIELKTFKQRVALILKEQEQARNNDGSLMAFYIDRFHKELVVVAQIHGKDAKMLPLGYMRRLPSSQSIRLARQLIQNTDGKYLPTDPKVCKARNIKEKDIRDCEWREAKQTTV